MIHSRSILRSTTALTVLSLAVTAAMASPEAGSVIGNQAVASYVNAAGDTITVTSNKVETIVQQVAGLTLTADNTETIAPGGKAFLPHIVVNEGNGPDAFDLAAVEGAGSFDFASVTIYADANMDGVADNATPIAQTPTLAPGERFGFVIDATARSDAASGSTESLTVTATSQLDATESRTNTDRLTVSSDAIMELVKSMTVDKSGGDPNIVDPGDTVEITLTYTNTGLAPSSNYAVEDVLDGRLPYASGSAQWSDRAVTGGLDETNGTGVDATNGAGETIAYDYNATTNTLDFVVSSVAAGRSGSVTFTATIGTDAGAGIIENVATQSDASGNYAPSNTASIRVDQSFAVDISDTYTQADATVLTSATDDGGAGDDTVTETSDISQAGTIAFEFVIGNDSNEIDSYALSVANTDFPPGTTFRFVGADGATPVVGDVGPLAPGEGTKVTLLATLPTDATPTAAGATNYTATVTATSQGDGAADLSTAEFAGAVTAATVDLENRGAPATAGDGAFATNGGAPWITTATEPEQAVTFPMNIENLGPTSDSYNLSLVTPLPADWLVEFRLADGTIVTNTGTIPSGASRDIDVIVTPPAGAPPATTLVEIALVSPVSGQGDQITNAITVSEVADLSITEDQTVQAAPGGVVDILHTVTNEGNIDITAGTITQAGLTEFSGAIFHDANGDGVLNSTDPVVTDFSEITGGLPAGETLSLIYRVQAGSVPGQSEIGTLTLGSSLNGGALTDADPADNAVTDRITVVSGDITLVKTQAIDPGCTGTPGVFTEDRQDVDPNQCIRYRITASNTGTDQASSVVIQDIVPAYTTLESCGTACPATVTPAATSAVNTAAAPNIRSTHGVLDPGGVATLEFTVRVDG